MSDSGPFPVEPFFTVISVSEVEDDHQSLARISSGSNWRLLRARNCVEAVQALGDNPAPIAICERDLPDGAWQDILARMRWQADPPLLIVSSRAADEALWSEVLDAGGWDVLAKPFDPEEVRSAVEAAWNECRRRQRSGRVAAGC